MKYAKLIIAFFLIIIIYFIFSQIRLVHQDTLPIDQRSEIVNKEYVRKLLLENTIKLDKPNNDYTFDKTSEKFITRPLL